MASSDVLMSIKCYLKILMHSFKYPHATVNGVLIGEKKKKKDGNGSYIELVDCIPLFHMGHGLTPMLEIALHQISNYLKKLSLTISGYYQANKFFVDSSPNVFAQKIAEKIWEQNNDAIMIMLNNFGLASTLDESNDVNACMDLYHFIDNKWKQKNSGLRIDQPDNVPPAISKLIYEDQNHLNLIDFDNHLDDIKCDWTNKHINELIDKL